mgnify:CR=1 FL=1
MLDTPVVSVLCVLAASVLGAAGQYLFKFGVERFSHGPLAFLYSPWVWAGMACYIAVMLLFTHAFRRGGTVTVLYPIYATTFIWAAAMGWIWYGQPIRPIHVVGMILLIGGMFLMGVGNAAPGKPATSSSARPE